MKMGKDAEEEDSVIGVVDSHSCIDQYHRACCLVPSVIMHLNVSLF